MISDELLTRLERAQVTLGGGTERLKLTRKAVVSAALEAGLDALHDERRLTRSNGIRTIPMPIKLLHATAGDDWRSKRSRNEQIALALFLAFHQFDVSPDGFRVRLIDITNAMGWERGRAMTQVEALESRGLVSIKRSTSGNIYRCLWGY